MTRRLKASCELALIDLDGTLFRGNSVIPGAQEFVSRLRANGVQPVFFTNNSTRTERQVAAKLTDLGISAKPDEVCTTAVASAAFVGNNNIPPQSHVLYIGSEGVREGIVKANLIPVHAREAMTQGVELPIRALIIGMDPDTTYRELAVFCRYVACLGEYVLTNGDVRLPTDEGFLPGTGAIGTFVEVATGVKPTIIGKPSAAFVDYALTRFGKSAEQTSIIGDNLMTDIAAGVARGVHSILVLSGVETRLSLAASTIRPDEVYDSVDDLFR